jgi:D-3-phosphoglycerate dehydrogenase
MLPSASPPSVLLLGFPESPPAEFAFIHSGPPPDPQFPPPDLAEAEIILTRGGTIDAAMIGAMPRCLAIIHLGPGIGPQTTRIDCEGARRAGIYVASIPDYATDTWADGTLALMERAAERAWGGNAATPLKGRRLGLIGLGQVGQAVARRAIERGMRLLACDPFCPKNNYDVQGIEPQPLNELIGSAEIVSLHLPLGPATRGMIGPELALLFQSGSILVNTSAAELIDPEALASALRRGRPAVAAFDVMPPEINRLSKLSQIILGTAPLAESPADRRECLRRSLEIATQVKQGERPTHLLIDPPCPRQMRSAPHPS